MKTWQERAEVIRWMLETGQGPKAAIEHFKLTVNERTIRIWRTKIEQAVTTLEDGASEAPPDQEGEPEEVDPERKRRDEALELLAQAGTTVKDVADQMDATVGEVRGWVVAWIADAEQTPASAGKRFDIPSATIARWITRARRPHLEEIDLSQLQENHDGTLKATPLNLSLIFRGDPYWRDRCRWDDFAQVALFREGASDDHVPLTDAHQRDVQLHIAAKWNMNVSMPVLQDGLLWWSQQHRFHPVRRYLEACADAWDGVQRLDRLLEDYFRTEPDALSAVFSRKWLVSAVARIFQPGCKVDTVLIVRGPEGTKKSTAFEVLTGEWFSDAAFDIRNHVDAAMALNGAWMIELAELDQLSKAEISAVRSFITRRVDRYRAPYGRHPEAHPRQGVLVGTTNEATFLPDSPQNRRFWVRRQIPGQDADLDALRRDRAQIWGEAVAVYRQRRPHAWWLTGDEARMAEAGNALFRSMDPWTELIDGWLSAHRKSWDGITTGEIFEHILALPPAKQGWREQARVKKVMLDLGYKHVPRSRTQRGRVWRLETPGA